MKKPFWKIFIERLILALVLVLITYNIWGTSYYSWISGTFEGVGEIMGALKIVAGIVLGAFYIALMWATWRAKGPLGIILMFVVLGGFVYLLQVGNVINLQKPSTSILVLQLVLATALAVGSTWSIFWRQVTGQVSVEDPDSQEHD